MIVTRYAFALKKAPHVESVRLALVNALFAHGASGRFQLRLDDSEPLMAERAEAIQMELAWLGLRWDEVRRQSEQQDDHVAAVEKLKRDGRLYPCFESDVELSVKHELRIRRGQPPVYDRAMLSLTAAQRAAAEASGKRPHWRFKLSDQEMTWRDLVLGRRRVVLPSVSDPVMVDAEGRLARNLVATIEDLASGVSHVIASDDRPVVAAVQMDVMAALGVRPGAIAFAHLPPLDGVVHERAASRFGATTLRQLRADGIEPAALLACLAAAGMTMPATLQGYDQLASAFDLTRVSRSPKAFDVAAMLDLNRQALRSLSFEDVQARLPHGATAAFWNAIRGDLDLMAESRGYWDVVAGTIVPPVIEGERAFLRTALRTLPVEPWNETVFPDWTEALQKESGREGSSLVLPLRLALTGEEKGPDLTSLLPLIGRVRAVQRLLIAAH